MNIILSFFTIKEALQKKQYYIIYPSIMLVLHSISCTLIVHPSAFLIEHSSVITTFEIAFFLLYCLTYIYSSVKMAIKIRMPFFLTIVAFTFRAARRILNRWVIIGLNSYTSEIQDYSSFMLNSAFFANALLFVAQLFCFFMLLYTFIQLKKHKRQTNY